MSQTIPGVRKHPQKDQLREYSFEAPVGSWTGRLDNRAWGHAANLLCYFTEPGSDKGYCLSVFNNKGYQPYQGEIAFDTEPLGGLYAITTEKSRAGAAKFVKAIRLKEG